jgi:hypothetical protein
LAGWFLAVRRKTERPAPDPATIGEWNVEVDRADRRLVGELREDLVQHGTPTNRHLAQPP